MTDQLIRIGKGPKGPRVKRPAHYWIVAAAVLISVSALIVVVYIWGPAQKPMAIAPQQPLATATVDIKGACAVLIPVMSDSADQILLLSQQPDGSTVNWDAIDKTIDNLRAVRPIVPVDMHADVQAQIDLLVDLKQRHDGVLPGSATIDFTEFRGSGLRIGARCAQVVD